MIVIIGQGLPSYLTSGLLALLVKEIRYEDDILAITAKPYFNLTANSVFTYEKLIVLPNFFIRYIYFSHSIESESSDNCLVY